ncbi:diacylglycerol kinase family protein [Flavobacteriaceae bacterium SZ-1-7]|uniref:diacylglycerol/lipid kinase family protein n=1 Tax=Tamlana sedimenti TaxID=3134126 RepID=UPI003121F16A
MTQPKELWFVIINPASGNGSGKRKWPKIKRLLEQEKLNFYYALTEYSKHSLELAQNAIKKDIRNIICVGGDGTLHNIVNGVLSQNIVPSQKITVGVIPVGTGNDWVKTYGIPKDIKKAVDLIINGRTKTQDIGKIQFENSPEPPTYFNNLAGIGFDGFVVSRVETYKHLGSLSYLWAAIIGLFAFKNFEVKIIANSEEISGETLMILIGICQYSGGGMQFTSTPNPHDGLFDVTIGQNLSKYDIIRNLHRLFNATITLHKKVKTLKTNTLKIKTSVENPPLIQVDGELLGSGNIEISIVPKVFSFYF